MLDVQADRDILKALVDRQALQLDRASTACMQLQDGHQSRVKEAKRVRTDVQKEVNFRFNEFLKRRRHSGCLQIDYKEHLLTMEVSHLVLLHLTCQT